MGQVGPTEEQLEAARRDAELAANDDGLPADPTIDPSDTDSDATPEGQATGDYHEIVYKGEKIKVAQGEEAINLMQKGKDYETKMEEVKAKRDALEAERRKFDDDKWGTASELVTGFLGQQAKENPALTVTELLGMVDPGAVPAVSPLPPAAQQQPRYDEFGEPVTDPALDPAVATSLREIESLKGKMAQMEATHREQLERAEAQRSAAAWKSRIEATMDEHDIFGGEGERSRDIGARMIVSALRGAGIADPNSTEVDQVIKKVADDMRFVRGDAIDTERTRLEAAAQAARTSPDGTGDTSAPPELADMTDEQVRRRYATAYTKSILKSEEEAARQG